MEIFAWTPAGSETLDSFNDRVRAFCDASPVIDVQVSVAHTTLLLSLTEALDAESEGILPLITPRVAFLPAEALPAAETQLGAVLEALRATNTDQNPCIPFRTTLYPLGTGAAAVILIGGEDIDLSDEGDDGPDPNNGAIPPGIKRGR